MKPVRLVLLALSVTALSACTKTATTPTTEPVPPAMSDGKSSLDVPATTRVAPDGSKIARVQEALNARGANLVVDGLLGAQTREAIKEFQKTNDLKPTGVADRATLRKLGVE